MVQKPNAKGSQTAHLNPWGVARVAGARWYSDGPPAGQAWETAAGKSEAQQEVRASTATSCGAQNPDHTGTATCVWKAVSAGPAQCAVGSELLTWYPGTRNLAGEIGHGRPCLCRHAAAAGSSEKDSAEDSAATDSGVKGSAEQDSAHDFGSCLAATFPHLWIGL